MNFETLTYLTYLLGIISIVFFFKKNDEFPFVVTFFLWSAGINRYEVVQSGKANWVVVAYAKSIFSLDNALAIEALNLFVIGTWVFAISYMLFSFLQKKPKRNNDSDKYFKTFFGTKKNLVIVLFVFFSLINSIATTAFSTSSAIAYGNGYAFLFGFGIGGLILLMYLVFKSITFKKQGLSKLIFGVLIGVSAYLSYNPTTRFQFISWIVAIGIVVVKDMSPWKKLRLYAIGGFGVFLVFSLAGVARMADTNTVSWDKKIELAIERGSKTEDQNMLDGFMMVLQVYPHHLDYQYGLQHLEILMRPIPRAWWPGKPVGGYANKLGLNDNMGGGTVGISESIYGTFYGEGGIVGIIIISIIYGYLFVWLFKTSQKYSSDLRYLIKGIILASTVPLLRGGDLPGIFAFIGMTYWPVFILIYQYNNYLRKQKFIAKRKLALHKTLTSKGSNVPTIVTT